jgi:hypothetical protein
VIISVGGPNDGDDATMVADVECEPSEVQEITEGHAQAKSPQKENEADVNVERVEVLLVLIKH